GNAANEICVALAADGMAALLGKSSRLTISSLADKRQTQTPKLPDATRTIRSFTPESGEQLLWQRDTELGARAEFTRHGLLVWGKFTACLYDLRTGKQRGEWTWDKPGDLTALALAPDGATLAAVLTQSFSKPESNTSSLMLVDLTTGRGRVVRGDIAG